MKRINRFLAVVLLLSLAVASQAVAYQYQAPITLGLTDGGYFSLVKLGAYDGSPIQPGDISVSSWTSEVGLAGWDVFLSGAASQGITGFWYANEQNPVLHLGMNFMDTNGIQLSVGSYTSDQVDPWFLFPPFANSYFTVGQFQAVPEPASVMLIGAGVLGLVGFGRKKR